VLPDHLAGLLRQDVPQFMGLVDKDANSIRLFSLAPLWFLQHPHASCPDCSSLRLVPRVDGAAAGPVGPPKRLGKVTSSPESYEYEVDLGAPVASLSVEDTANRQTLLKQKAALRRCIEHDLRSLVFARARLPQFYWIAESDREPEGPVPAFASVEAPQDSESLRSIYSLLGPALLPLALRYQSDNRKDLLAALRTLFREMPANTIPPELQKALPGIFGR
jgi:hypothetical protein